MLRFNGLLQLPAEARPNAIVVWSFASDKHTASARSGEFTPRFFIASLLSTCILPELVK